jgi:hypothetical protein
MIFMVFAAAVIGGVLGLINNIVTPAGVSAQRIQAIYGGIISWH